MTQEELLNKGLPKWPQMIVTGKSVTSDQALDIIFRTDSFLTDCDEWSGGNAKQFNNWYREISGLNNFRIENGGDSTDFKLLRPFWDKRQQFLDSIGFISTNYVHNSWGSCAFIFGPHGWCHPDGTIQYSDNIGKYPSVEEVLEDWTKLAVAFPYLDLNVTLMSDESGEDHKIPVVNNRVINGIATLEEPNLEVHSESNELFGNNLRLMDAAHRISFMDPVSRECGFSQPIYEMFAKRVRQGLEEIELNYVASVEE